MLRPDFMVRYVWYCGADCGPGVVGPGTWMDGSACAGKLRVPKYLVQPLGMYSIYMCLAAELVSLTCAMF